MKSCELCKSPARIYCESDQANLCWTCDRKVHSANFLVARHSRNLLCRVCQSPTPWTASGEKLGPSAVSVCEKCTSDEDDREESHGEINDDDDDDSVEYEEEEEEEEDNQVVPLSTTPPPPAASSSNSSDGTVLMKRKRENVAPHISDEEDDEEDCISVRRRKGVTFYEFLSPNSEDIAGKGREKTGVVVGLDLNTSISEE